MHESKQPYDKINLMPNRNPLPSSFTLIELLIVIAMLGILSALTVTVSIQYINRGKITRANGDMDLIVKAVESARLNTHKQLGGSSAITGTMGITTYYCSACLCVPTYGYTPQSPECYDRWLLGLKNIESASDIKGIINLDLDPWGTPYIMDENEEEYSEGVNGGPCRQDTIRSAGPNRTIDIADDIIVRIPFSTSRCVQP